MSQAIMAKYGEARLPRYTSYPTAPHFGPLEDVASYRDWIGEIGQGERTSLYLHVPFCRAMCWYCGCHTTITRHDQPIADYVDLLRREAELVAEARKGSLNVGEIHFGGGTPTIMQPAALTGLMEALRDRLGFAERVNVAIEIDPRTLTAEMAAALGAAGVTRASLGVQSFDPVVQKAINRIQSVESTALAVERLRQAGISALSFDLIYGLPHQTVKSCVETVEAAVALRPDRLAVFGYAHVPDFKKHQRMIDENALPDAQGRNEQAEAIAQALVAAGYERIGLDHFALPEDDLCIAAHTGRLHRNFQGYTTDECRTLIGLGASAIGKFAQGYVQNAVPLGLYADRIGRGRFAAAKGYGLTAEDRLRAELIERVMCDFSVDVEAVAKRHGFAAGPLLSDNATLEALHRDGLIEIDGATLRVDERHRFVVRIAASAFDAYLAAGGRAFSKAA
ncbi:oxygen-independent coproporphyrinogen III oxidase (plasmid) [Rhizobium sp. TRM96647]|uniref:oxygen-independent coproporphyrinogen III oxidase n=1 Tax=unclassified Rhizobium TaxID=2613769 RepID=UPI0021E7BFFC|nr:MULTISPECIES: oxygen-independent coproporphyrinogen III oxidase [unclassified Rhizobium]MCV3735371.1 oxygen-independent coproporphyrinogen III oxidase [Rhizobium sp. TRM96647]MCV3757866.1 oxygen-independent coproporphyrinogen III oxidase [Rhizobium sp. TRM96650]